ncbi:MAG TPA: (d)CMP kinase [Actinomycetota bacterium]|nr:(d)CMP kinase [Actinomycetota bacterium]
MPPVIVAVDGPSGSGKSSVSKGVAQRLGFAYLDTGAMYRAVTWWALHEEIGVDAVAGRIGQCAILSGTDPAAPTISVDGTDVSEAIRTPEVTAAVSAYSAVPEVRTALVEQQRRVAAGVAKGLVAEGRDLGTVVFPDADLKVYLTADVAARAQRRAAENAQRGHNSDVGDTHQSLTARDAADSGRAVSPLQVADDAVEVDATHLTLAEVIDHVTALVKART